MPSCANDWLLQTVARDNWNFDGYITSDCDADADVFRSHHFTQTPEEAVRTTGRRTGRAILYTSALLLAGFGVLYTSAFPPNQMFAVLASIVIAAALFADLVMLPALLLWIRPRVPGVPQGL